MRAPALLTVVTLALSGCVLDRTGTSATSGLEREMALRDARVSELERIEDESARRIKQLEEVIRYRGQQEAEKLENIGQIRDLMGQVTGELEVLRHELEGSDKVGGSFREDTDFRLTWIELRLDELEDNLGLKPPPPPARADDDDDEADSEDGEADGDDDRARSRTGDEDDEEVVEVPDTPEAILTLAKEHLADGRPRAARAVLQRFLEDHKDDKQADEATYRLAESYFNDGEYQQAILRFQDVVDSYGGTGWAAWSMVRQGECFKKLGKASEAQLFWEDVLARYPRSKAAEEAKRLLGR